MNPVGQQSHGIENLKGHQARFLLRQASEIQKQLINRQEPATLYNPALDLSWHVKKKIHHKHSPASFKSRRKENHSTKITKDFKEPALKDQRSKDSPQKTKGPALIRPALIKSRFLLQQSTTRLKDSQADSTKQIPSPTKCDETHNYKIPKQTRQLTKAKDDKADSFSDKVRQDSKIPKQTRQSRFLLRQSATRHITTRFQSRLDNWRQSRFLLRQHSKIPRHLITPEDSTLPYKFKASSSTEGRREKKSKNLAEFPLCNQKSSPFKLYSYFFLYPVSKTINSTQTL